MDTESNTIRVDKQFRSIILFIKHRCANIGRTIATSYKGPPRGSITLSCYEVIYLRKSFVPAVKASLHVLESNVSSGSMQIYLPLSARTCYGQWLYVIHRLLSEPPYGNLIFLGCYERRSQEVTRMCGKI